MRRWESKGREVFGKVCGEERERLREKWRVEEVEMERIWGEEWKVGEERKREVWKRNGR